MELASAILVIVLGAWLLLRALRHRHSPAGDSKALAFFTGLVPCPLTTFIMVYASARGLVWAGLAITGAMAAGMVVTILLFVLAAMLLRGQALGFLARTERARERLGRILEAGGALAVMAFGLWMFINRTV